jgi:DNA-binding HxlR family transcriptional regulator
VDGYGQYCPVALGAEVFAQRWTPIILRNLLVGCERFGDILAGAPGLPRSVLAQRLRRLERDGIVSRSASSYRLTACGQELAQVCLALGAWGARWRETRPEHHTRTWWCGCSRGSSARQAAPAARGGPVRRAGAPAAEPVLAGRGRGRA